jgi:hypothetical protein
MAGVVAFVALVVFMAPNVVSVGGVELPPPLACVELEAKAGVAVDEISVPPLVVTVMF